MNALAGDEQAGGWPAMTGATNERRLLESIERLEAVTPRYTSQDATLEMSRRMEQAERRAEDAEAAIEATHDLLDGWEQDGPDDQTAHLLIQRVREMLDLPERFRAARGGAGGG